MRLRDRHAFYMDFLHPFDKCHAVGNILLLDCHTKPTPTNPTLKWKYPVTTLPFTQLVSHPSFSIGSTTPVFSLNLKFPPSCVNVVLYTFFHSPRAAIPCFCQILHQANGCICCFSPNDSMLMSTFIFVHVSLCWHFGN